VRAKRENEKTPVSAQNRLQTKKCHLKLFTITDFRLLSLLTLRLTLANDSGGKGTAPDLSCLLLLCIADGCPMPVGAGRGNRFTALPALRHRTPSRTSARFPWCLFLRGSS